MKTIHIDFRYDPNVIEVRFSNKEIKHCKKVIIKGESIVATDETGRHAWIEIDDNVELDLIYSVEKD